MERIKDQVSSCLTVHLMVRALICRGLEGFWTSKIGRSASHHGRFFGTSLLNSKQLRRLLNVHEPHGTNQQKPWQRMPEVLFNYVIVFHQFSSSSIDWGYFGTIWFTESFGSRGQIEMISLGSNKSSSRFRGPWLRKLDFSGRSFLLRLGRKCWDPS